ncbi:MAG: D-alanyl-D-alanine carboxypeptidase family protein [Pseudomonadota bacterium]
MLRTSLLSLALAFGALPTAAQTIDTAASSALVVDYETGAVLLSKNAEVPLPPASMSKLMTLNMLFEALASGRLGLDDTFRVSTRAWQMKGSSMFLREGEQVKIIDLIRGIIIHSGNDACVVVAEGLAGSEEAFARQMTERARELGMEDSVFTNSTGWPHPGQRMSARDLVFLGDRMVREFPQFYPYFVETEFTWDGITQQNRNPLLYMNVGGDGLKTGHTEEAGFGLVGSAAQGERRIMFMISGLETSRDRSVEAERITSWSFREFETRVLFDEGVRIAEANVWIGDRPTVGLVANGPVRATLPRADRDETVAHIVYNGPIEAPIAAGQHLADLVIDAPHVEPVTVPLYAEEDVAEGGFVTRFTAASGLLIEDLLEMAATAAAE